MRCVCTLFFGFDMMIKCLFYIFNKRAIACVLSSIALNILLQLKLKKKLSWFLFFLSLFSFFCVVLAVSFVLASNFLFVLNGNLCCMGGALIPFQLTACLRFTLGNRLIKEMEVALLSSLSSALFVFGEFFFDTIKCIQACAKGGGGCVLACLSSSDCVSSHCEIEKNGFVSLIIFLPHCV